MNSLESTEIFMRAAGQSIPDVPTLPSASLADFRLSLIEEEMRELSVAIIDGNLVEILDALADLRVVCDGAVLAFGLGKVFPAALVEVARSNASKFPSSMPEVFETIQYYAAQGTPAMMAVVDDNRYVIKRQSDGKILKSINYSPANLAPLLA